MDKMEFKGLMAPVFTPFNKDGSINLTIIPKYIEYLKQNGIKGILVNGTSGEGMSLTISERKLLTEKWIENAKPQGIHVMVQIGGVPLPLVVDLAKHAEISNADSLLCLPDLYVKPQSNQDLIDYLKIISLSVPKTPLLYYHIPMFTNVNLHMGSFLEEIPNHLSNFAGIKFTSNDLVEGHRAVLAQNKKFQVFLGADTLILPATVMGFDSFIATTLNIFPRIGAEIVFNLKMDTQNKLSDYVNCITKYGGWVPTMKTAMNILTPIDCGPVRAPMKCLTKLEMQNLTADLQQRV